MTPQRKAARRIVYVGTALVVGGMVLDVVAGNPWIAIGLGTGYSYGLLVMALAVAADRRRQQR